MVGYLATNYSMFLEAKKNMDLWRDSKDLDVILMQWKKKARATEMKRYIKKYTANKNMINLIDSLPDAPIVKNND